MGVEGLFYGPRLTWWRRLAWLPVWVAAQGYAAFMCLRAWAYRVGALRSVAPSVPVVAIGNLVVGGTGKTPLAVDVVERLARAGRKPAVVSRGYRGSLEGRVAVASDGREILLNAAAVGDEPVMMARRLLSLGAPVVVGADRPAAVEKAAGLGADVVVCDDAFQHLRLRRRVNIVSVDGSRAFGNGATLPLGPLREPMGAIRRVDAVVIGEGARSDEAIEAVRSSGFVGPILRRSYRVRGVIRLDDGEALDVSVLKGATVHAAAATANPAGFVRTLENLGARVLTTTFKPDHHAWRVEDWENAARVAAHGGFMYHAATEKDAVKLDGFGRPGGVPILILQIEIAWTEGDAERLEALLSERL